MDSNTIVIVTGLQRSGTAMMMQMLEKGGLEPFVDGKQKANILNPNGFYNHSAVFNLANDHSFLDQAVNKSVKVFSALLSHLPNHYQYKIIVMNRDLNEIRASKNKVKKMHGQATLDDFFAIKKRELLKQIIEKSEQWMAKQTNIEKINIDYAKVIENPLEYAKKINAFLGNQYNVERMAQAVDANLYREKGEQHFLVTDRAPNAVAKVIDQYVKDKIYCEIGIGEGHILNAVTSAKKVLGVEHGNYGVQRCKEIYPHLDIIHGDILNHLPSIDFDVCYLWIIFPACGQIIDAVLEKNEDTVIIMGLNYFYHLDSKHEKAQKYINAYPKSSKVATWNEDSNAYLTSLEARGFKHEIVGVEAENGELFSLAIIQKKD